ncbi:uncharacterized protein LOC110697523 isoform X2 [Chenopodium quinoa]|uniref:uncharacterized protein LOC110695832 isoform X2 n=1 Tax=Chenopodium quinoa TaxID=63459 RepID=UPI000B7748DB|nr:uncharacterized protein LOC110695832 isoform X2 [Chenopodium quinoa]XP_021730584.1 uncharacterized protein LOC110697523 isoform X2 [Chenopodium quinoa]
MLYLLKYFLKRYHMMLLLVSNLFSYVLLGAQYIDGTTDITRTVHFGETTSREKECFTRVLQHSTSERHQHSTTEAHQYRNTEDHAAEPSKHSSLTSKQHSTTAEQQTPSTTTEQNRNTAAQALKPVTQSA